MASLARPLLVVSDTHLGTDTRSHLGADLARLIDAHPEAEVVFGGDAFDLSHAPRHEDQGRLLSTLLDQSPEFVASLRRRLAAGHPVTVLAGNHDAALAGDDMGAILRARLDVTDGAPIALCPWFVRRGDVHLEHGHVYDPDNAPIHPLAEWSEQTEPLGIALTRRFVVATGAEHFSHAQDATPARSLARAFRLYGLRAPGMIASYFKTAISLCMKGGPALAPREGQERQLGASRLDEFAAESGLSGATLSDLLTQMPRPTHLSRRDLFLRLYFDRVFASLILAGSLAAIPRKPTAAITALASFAYLAGSTMRGHDRYGALPPKRLQIGAARVRETTGARLVVFGHTHHVVVDDGYLNTGSFAFPRGTGRPYVYIDKDGAAELRRSTAT
ncbi:MAG TPA: metallophosphoesterase [Polyangiaceae bacterium]|nr:metallophosphoesterase [Polyangiaceae bacterium]